MGVAVLQVYPVKEGSTGASTLEMLTKRVIALGAVPAGHFLVDCETYGAQIQGPGGPRTLHLLHNSEFPASSFALLDVPPPHPNAPSRTVSLVADNVLDLLVLKMAPAYTTKKMKVEARGSRFEIGDFVVKLSSVLLQQSFKGLLVEVEYKPCVVPEACWDLLLEFVGGILGTQATASVPRTLQGKIKEMYVPLDTMQQYMDHFTNFRKTSLTTGIR